MKYELKSISVWAFLKITFFVNLVAGFLLGIILAPFVGILSVVIISMLQLEGTNLDIGNSLDSLMIGTPFILSFAFAFMLTLFEATIVMIYNMFARFVGGISFDIEIENENNILVEKQNTVLRESSKHSNQKTDNLFVKKKTYGAPPPLPPLNGNEDSSEINHVKQESLPQKEELITMTDKPVRVRIAPSPSGYLHVGTARMAIANFLYARHTGGQFLVRIENTDAARSDDSLIEPIISALKWLGIESDEEIVFQSDRIEMYKKFAQKILDDGKGYRCFCSPELLTADREEAMANKGPLRYNRRCLNLTQEEIDAKIAAGEKFATRIKIPEGRTTFTDIVSSDLKRDNREIEDFIIARSDGTATYNLAVVVDDNDMKISHVVRGNDHITNTFKQIHIYQALGFEQPTFGHVPLILRPDKKKVSKRLGDKDVAQYREEGILPEAMFNFLCLLGWSPKTDREIYNVKELIEIFNPDHFNNANSIFNEEKLEAFNKEHIALKSDHDLATEIAPLLVEAGFTTKYWLETRWEYLRSVVSILKTRARRMSDFVELSKYFFEFDYKYDEKADEKNFTPDAIEILNDFSERLEKLETFTKETIENTLSEYALEKEFKKGKLIHPTRLAVSGIPSGPGLYDLLLVLGQDVVVERMKKAAIYIQQK